MLATVSSAALQGIHAAEVQVEVSVNEFGEPDTFLVGLPDVAVRESRNRVTSALLQCGFTPLRTRATINLAPGHLRKEGPLYDLPIALGILIATHQLETERIGDFLIAGELSLSGETRPVRGALALARLAECLGRRGVLLPGGSAEVAALAGGVPAYRIDSLGQACQFLAGAIVLEPVAAPVLPAGAGPAAAAVDFAELKGQPALRRAIEVAVAGSHNLLVIGPPGSGKSMAARRIPTLMPAPSRHEQLEILAVHSAAGPPPSASGQTLPARPFRSPHHTASHIALIGGGALPRPGEISLAHHGVLFLDELPEFNRSSLEVLRQPLEDGEVTISRANAKLSFPCAFMLVAAMNPCPCGHLGDSRKRCRCTPSQIEKYRRKISGPLLDRIDLHVEAPALTFAEMRSSAASESSAAIRERVLRARERQGRRFAGTPTAVNARMTHAQIRQACALAPALGDLLQSAMEKLSLSARAYDRILKVARTIADLAGADAIEAPHLLEAIQYRALDRTLNS